MSVERDLAERVMETNQVYVEHDSERGIMLCCDICRDQDRERAVKQLGWQVLTVDIVNEVANHLSEHPVVRRSNDA